jgi:peroxiredoxin
MKKINWLQVVTLVVIGLLMIEVVILTIQNRELKTAISNLTQSQIEPLKHGEKVEPFKIQTLSGDTAEFTYSDTKKRYLLFVLSTKCPHCQKNLLLWKEIANTANETVNIFGISLDNFEQTKQYASTKDIGFYLASVADTSFGRKYKIGGVPETILIDGNSTVEKVWIGKLSKESLDDIKILMGAPKALTN